MFAANLLNWEGGEAERARSFTGINTFSISQSEAVKEKRQHTAVQFSSHSLIMIEALLVVVLTTVNDLSADLRPALTLLAVFRLHTQKTQR